MEGEVVRIDIAKTDLEWAVYHGYLQTIMFKIIKVDVPGYDYSNSEEWKAQKRIADKEYAKLKEIEFKIRHK
jgi:hypothetical protein